MTTRRNFLQWGSAALAGAALLPRSALAQQSQLPSLDALARAKGLRFGTATSGGELGHAGLSELIRRECSVLVAENAFKWKHLEPRSGQYNWQEADAIAAFATANQMELRGHCFVWSQDNRIPQWQLSRQQQLSANSGEGLIREMWRHADAITKRFPQVASWDAMNEMILPGQGTVRESMLVRILGEQAIDVAFSMMREKAPNAQLVYNDYMCWERSPKHRDGVLRLLEGAVRRGVPVQALGIQSHLGGSLAKPIDEAGWRRFLEQIQALGLDVLITELDCSDRNIVARDPAQRDAETAAFVKGYLDLTLSFTNVKRVLLWTISDKDSYFNRPAYPAERRRPDGLPIRGHVFDEALNAKPMRRAVAEAFAAAPSR